MGFALSLVFFKDINFNLYLCYRVRDRSGNPAVPIFLGRGIETDSPARLSFCEGGNAQKFIKLWGRLGFDSGSN